VGNVNKGKRTIPVLNGAPRDTGRRFGMCVSTDVYVAMVKEQDRRKAEIGAVRETRLDRNAWYGCSFSRICEDALIMYLGVGSEESEDADDREATPEDTEEVRRVGE
jgi:hypothetical protein